MQTSSPDSLGSTAMPAIFSTATPGKQAECRAKLYAAHQKALLCEWDENGYSIWKNGEQGGYRAMLWQCLSLLAGGKEHVARANRIIVSNYNPSFCAFAPGAALDILFHYRDKLEPDALSKLERYTQLNVPLQSTEDLKIHGYNDNHVHKAIHTVIVGGEMLGIPALVERGLHRLRQAVEVFERNGFPCEYNSPNYTPVSLQPLASLVEQAQNAEARELALKLERFYWQDLALHFDPRIGLPTGPLSRCGANDYDGLLSGTLCLVSHLYPERFGFDLAEEMYAKGRESQLIAPSLKSELPFLQAHPLWYARPTYHPTAELEEALFERKAGTYIRGTIESGTSPLTWPNEETKPANAPAFHPRGPRRSLLSTFFGENYTLGTAQYSWLNNGQTHSFYATLQKAAQEKTHPANATVYFARQFFNENYPYGETPGASTYFAEEGDIRTLQHRNTAIVFYNPHPYQRMIQRIRTAICRPLAFSQPKALFVGETEVPTLNYVSESLQPISIDEGEVYVGIIPLQINDSKQCRRKALQIHTYSDHLSILMSSFEGWGPEAFTYEEILETHAGFVFEIHAAADFGSFAEFRQWLSKGEVSDDYYAQMRTTTYQREGLRLSASYSPYQGAFRYASINRRALSVPVSQIDGMKDPGCGFAVE